MRSPELTRLWDLRKCSGESVSGVSSRRIAALTLSFSPQGMSSQCSSPLLVRPLPSGASCDKY